MRLSVLRPRAEPGPPDEPQPGGPPPPLDWRQWVRLPRRQDLREAVTYNWRLKLFSLLLSFFVWYSINVTERDAERLVELPVSVRRIPQGLIVTNSPNKPVQISLRGPRTILEGVDEHRVRVALDLSTVSPGEVTVELTPEMIKPELARRLTVVRVQPARLKLRVERIVRRTLPVHVDLAGTPAFGYTVGEPQVVPDKVEVTGPARQVDDLKEVSTEAIDLRGLKDTVVRSVPLTWVGDFVSYSPDQVTVTINFDEGILSRDFKNVPVSVANASLPTRLIPPSVDLTVRGPQRVLHLFKIPDGAVHVDAAGLGAGSHRVTVQVDLPAPLEVVGRQPDVHTLVLGGKGGGR